MRISEKKAVRASQSPYGAMGSATDKEIVAVLFANLESQSPYGAMGSATLTPPFLRPGRSSERGVYEKDEVWNMHKANNGSFWGFMPMKPHRREGR